MPPPALSPTLIPASASTPSTTTTASPSQLDLRQEAVPSDCYFTVSISRSYTTYITTLFLAGAPSCPSSPPPPSLPSSISSPSASGFLVPAATSTTTVSPSSIPNATSPDQPQSVIIGAIVGTIMGSFFLLVLLWLCFCRTTIRSAESVSNSGESASTVEARRQRRQRRPRRVRVVHARGFGRRRASLDDD